MTRPEDLPFFFDGITKDDTQRLLSVDGAFPAGIYLLRNRAGVEGQYVLSINYKNRVTHHKVAKNEDGVYLVNNSNFGDHTTIEGVLDTLSHEPLPARWPVLLHDPVINQEQQTAVEPSPGPAEASVRRDDDAEARNTTSEQQEQDQEQAPQQEMQPAAPADQGLSAMTTNTAAPAPPRHRAQTQQDSQPQPSQSSSGDETRVIVHPTGPFNEAKTYLKSKSQGDGTFFIMRREDGNDTQFVLFVVYKGRPTQHLVEYSREGNAFKVNNSTLRGATSLEAVVQELRKKHPFWPVPLTHQVEPAQSANNATDTNQADARAQAERQRQRRQEEQRLAEQKRREDAERRQRQEEEERRRREAAEEEQQRQKLLVQQKKDEEDRQRRDAEKKRIAEEEERERLDAKRRQDEIDHQRSYSQRRPDSEPVVLRESELNIAAKRNAQQQSTITADRSKRWDNGEQFDVHIRRSNPGVPFGFGIASMWRIDGKVKVISWVDNEGPARNILEVEDALVALDGKDVDDMELEEVKEVIRSLGNDFKARIFRPRVKRTHQNGDAAPVNSRSKVSSPKKQNGSSKKKIKAAYKRHAPRNGDCCGSMWCNHLSNLDRVIKDEEDTMKVVMKVNKRCAAKGEHVKMSFGTSSRI